MFETFFEQIEKEKAVKIEINGIYIFTDIIRCISINNSVSFKC